MLDDHTQNVQRIYDLVADEYATGCTFFQTVARELVSAAKLPSGRVLDVACGRGAIAEYLQLNRSDLQVFAMDISWKMLAANRAKQQGTWVRHQVNADAARLPFQNEAFNAVTCSQALPFLRHPERALREFKRVTRPGGVVAVSTNGPLDPNLSWYADLIREYSPAVSLVSRPLARRKDLRELLESEGYSQVQVGTLGVRVSFEDASAFWSFAMTTGMRANLEGLAEEQLDILHTEVEKGIADMAARANGIYVSYKFHVAKGSV
ncbi:class I SAM-dependent methyltransferase [Streptomyces sp. NPDC088775]|uniref:class I SAM-dependent methyltransferase n=1 Tax=Streptomyces sp. NPDC088775 TaxID=3365896 RepID=UPI0038047E3F